MTSQPWPPKLPVRHVRIARPTDQLDEVVRFYCEGLGLPELDRFAGHAGYQGVMLGLPSLACHLEFTQHDHGSPGLAPSRDNLLVLYFEDLTQVERVAARLAALGHLPVAAENPERAQLHVLDRAGGGLTTTTSPPGALAQLGGGLST